MKKYDKYKDSGIEWIGEIPEHWEVKRGDLLFRLKKNLIKKDDLNGIDLYHYSIPVIQEYGKALIENGSTIDSDKFEVSGNEILFSKLNPRKGTVALSSLHDKLAVASTEFVILEPLEDNIEYFFQSLSSDGFKTYISSLVESATKSHQRANPSDIHKAKFAVPPLSEQTAIANYLDRKTAELDELIADKKRLLELYEEEKTTIINQAVTKGINPEVKMKDSGIEWLGEIPEHWEVKKLKIIARVQTGRTPKIQNSHLDYFENGHLNWFTPADFDKNKELIESRRKIIKNAIEDNEVELFPAYSIYLVSIGATLGKVSFFRECASANQQINIITFNEGFNPLFGYYFLVGNKEMITLEADYTTLPILNQSKTKILLFAIPPLSEQQAIVQFIEKENTRIDAKIVETLHATSLLNEYRTALISEVVTGKIKVTE